MNQNFVCNPFARLQKQLQDKCPAWGIKYTSITKEYTSKSSFLSFDPPKHYLTRYAGKHTYRSSIRSTNGNRFNADINAAYNSIHKVNPSTFTLLIGAECVVDVGLYL